LKVATEEALRYLTDRGVIDHYAIYHPVMEQSESELTQYIFLVVFFALWLLRERLCCDRLYVIVDNILGT
jgi:hypothetical protein